MAIYFKHSEFYKCLTKIFAKQLIKINPNFSRIFGLKFLHLSISDTNLRGRKMRNNDIILEEKYLKEIYHDKSELPKKIRIDVSTKCQLNCQRCYMRMDKEGAENGCGLGNLKFENFKKFIDDNDFESIELSNHGEIFLNPEIDKIIEYANSKNIEMTMDNGVNLNYLPDSTAEIIVRCKVKRIDVSIDGASQETYQIYRRNGDFNKVIENIKKINFYKEKYHSDAPTLYYKFIVFGHNEHEIEQAKILAKNLNMEISFEQNTYPDFSPVRNPEMVIKQTGLPTIELPPHKLLEEYEQGISDWYYCAFLWDEPQINWDGKILGCCSLFTDDFGGNVFKEDFLTAMNNPKLIYAKNMITNNAPDNPAIPCSNCYMYQDMKANNKWLKSPKNR